MAEFHETLMGRKFFEADVPAIGRSLHKIEQLLEQLTTPVITVQSTMSPEEEAKVRKRLNEMRQSVVKSIMIDSGTAPLLEESMAGVVDIIHSTLLDVRNRLRDRAADGANLSRNKVQRLSKAVTAITRVCTDLTDIVDILRGDR